MPNAKHMAFQKQSKTITETVFKNIVQAAKLSNWKQAFSIAIVVFTWNSLYENYRATQSIKNIIGLECTIS